MVDLLAARSQMAISLGFHIIFACIGMAMPFFMSVAHWKYLKTRDKLYLNLTKVWMRGVAIFFAMGAVSGTALAFELGLLFPHFMEQAGPVIGLPFAWEGTAFFLEAIALGLYLYGWNRINQWIHWAAGLSMGIFGVLSALFVICANGWMNSPAGFDIVNGKWVNIDPVAAMFNPASLQQGIHMTIAAFAATGFAVAGLHAFLLFRERQDRLHAAAVRIALLFGAAAALLQPISGDLSAKMIAELQPEKFAAMESHFKTEKNASLLIGGIPIEDERKVILGLHIPGMLSFLAHGDFDSEVTGLEEFPEEDWPPVLVVHAAFQTMVGIGFLLVGLSLLYLLIRWKREHLLDHPWFLLLLVACTPLGFIAVEAGWVVTEVGRQPWVIYKVLRVSDAVTPMPGLWIPLLLFTGIYAALTAVGAWLMARQIKSVRGLDPEVVEEES